MPTSYQFTDVYTGGTVTVDNDQKLRTPHTRRLWFYGDPDQVFTDDTHTKLWNTAELKPVLKRLGIKQNKQVFDGLSDQSYDALCSCAGTTSTGSACGKLLLTGGGGRHVDRATNLTNHRANFRRATPDAPAVPFRLMCGPCTDAATAAASAAAT
eukprot:COSAG01_NODE_26122_length_723_cov_0.570513_1_plen_154_part_10